MVRDGDVHPERAPAEWAKAMQACADAAARLNLIIKEACQEAIEHARLDPLQAERLTSLLESTRAAVEQSERVLTTVRQRSGRPAELPTPGLHI